MKILLPLLLVTLLTAPVIAQTSNDAYNLQASKINRLLADRVEKFGQYESSLAQRTGIFGLKTKKDMQRSIDILTDIVTTDNNILRETKVLLDYKDFEKTQVQTQASDVETRMKGYMATITKLQQQNSELKEAIEKTQGEQNIYLYMIIGVGVVLVIVLVTMQRRR